MSPSIDAHQLSTLLCSSSELDIVGDITATVATPPPWWPGAHALPESTICAWRAEDSGNRYVHVSAAAAGPGPAAEPILRVSPSPLKGLRRTP